MKRKFLELQSTFLKKRFYLYTVIALSIAIIILALPSQCLSLSLNGLNLWFSKMIPALFPFMVLSGIIIRMDLVSYCVKLFHPLIGRLFRIRPSVTYGMLIGFLCGFPMGAHTASNLYERKMINKSEATFLLSFCNNIGPVYFISFVLPIIGSTRKAFCLFGMYGLPLLYGLLLRYTYFAKSIMLDIPYTSHNTASRSFLFDALDDSIFSSLGSITKLGGYMIFFNLLFIIPTLLIQALPLSNQLSATLIGITSCLLEITGGINLLRETLPYFVLCILPFGGMSCIAQTYSMIKNTDLSISEYVMHKAVLTAITVFYYLLSANLSFLP